MMAREGDLAPIRQPIHHWVQIPEVFQLWPAVVLPAALFQGPLQGRRLGGERQALAAGRLQLAGIAVVAALQIGWRRDLQPLLLGEDAQIELFAPALHLLRHRIQGRVHVAPEAGEQAEGLAGLGHHGGGNPCWSGPIATAIAAAFGGINADAKQLLEQLIAAARLALRFGVGLHSIVQILQGSCLIRPADQLLFRRRVVDAKEHGRISDVQLGLPVFLPQQPHHLLGITHALTAGGIEQIADQRLPRLAVAIDAAIALLQRHQRLGDVDMHQPVAEVVQVQAF
jgi:hypothetical protein